MATCTVMLNHAALVRTPYLASMTVIRGAEGPSCAVPVSQVMGADKAKVEKYRDLALSGSCEQVNVMVAVFRCPNSGSLTQGLDESLGSSQWPFAPHRHN